MTGNTETHPKTSGIISFLWPRFVDLWIFVAIATFFAVRLLGSHYAQRFIDAIKSSLLP